LKTRSIIAGVLVARSLAACATSQPDDLGVQAGYVSKIYAAGETPTEFPDCLVPLTARQGSAGRYVEVEFRQQGTKRYVNVFVAEGVALKVNEEVTLHSPYCVGSHRPEFIQGQR
jgi:hypothetical protein